MPIMNVCIGICKMHPKYHLCRGCYRSPLDLIKWPKATEKEKEDMVKGLKMRKELFGDITNE